MRSVQHWAAALAVGLAALASPCAGSRTRFLLDQGWLFQPGSAGVCSNATSQFPVDMTGVQCFGLTQVTTAQSEADCANACCGEAECQTYQWCPSGQSCGPADSCWIGDMNGGCTNAGGWLGRARNVSGSGTACSQVQCFPGTNDSDWRSLSVPHDFVVEVRPSALPDQLPLISPSYSFHYVNLPICQTPAGCPLPTCACLRAYFLLVRLPGYHCSLPAGHARPVRVHVARLSSLHHRLVSQAHHHPGLCPWGCSGGSDLSSLKRAATAYRSWLVLRWPQPAGPLCTFLSAIAAPSSLLPAHALLRLTPPASLLACLLACQGLL